MKPDKSFNKFFTNLVVNHCINGDIIHVIPMTYVMGDNRINAKFQQSNFAKLAHFFHLKTSFFCEKNAPFFFFAMSNFKNLNRGIPARQCKTLQLRFDEMSMRRIRLTALKQGFAPLEWAEKILLSKIENFNDENANEHKIN